MGRPPKKFKKIAVNLTIDPTLRDWANAYAFVINESLSEIFSRLLKKEIADYCIKKHQSPEKLLTKPPDTPKQPTVVGPANRLPRSA